MQVTLADLAASMALLTTQVELLYPQVDQDMLGIDRRFVAGGVVKNCYAAITVKVSADGDDVEYHVGLFVYNGVLLEGIEDGQFQMVDTDTLDAATIELLNRQIKARCAELGALLEAATSPAA